MAMKKKDFTEVFEALRKIMARHSKKLVLTKDDDSTYYLESTKHGPNGKPMFFGAVTMKKSYVSYHLMPVYVAPALLKGMSADLKKRMQGKSCFNFKEVDKPLFEELADLTKRGYANFKGSELI